jgi:hypothetical protein
MSNSARWQKDVQTSMQWFLKPISETSYGISAKAGAKVRAEEMK